ncbi:unnamed protein product, partial [Rotaria socialis]
MVVSNCDIQSLTESKAALSETLAHAVQTKSRNANSKVQVNTIRLLSHGALALDYQCKAVADLEAAKMALHNAVQRNDFINVIALRIIAAESEASERSQQNKTLHFPPQPAFKAPKKADVPCGVTDRQHPPSKPPKEGEWAPATIHQKGESTEATRRPGDITKSGPGNDHEKDRSPEATRHQGHTTKSGPGNGGDKDRSTKASRHPGDTTKSGSSTGGDKGG